jgi:hypothetical protein
MPEVVVGGVVVVVGAGEEELPEGALAAVLVAAGEPQAANRTSPRPRPAALLR